MSFSVTAAFFGSVVAPSNPNRSQHKLRCEAEASRKGPRTVRTGPGSDSLARLLPIQRWFVLFVHSEKETSEKDTKKDPLKVSYEPPETCYDHKPSVSHHVSSSLCLAAEADQPQKLVCRIVGVELAALVSYAQCQNGPSAHATNEDVVNPASDHGTENRKFSGITDGLKWNQNSFHSITYLLAEMQLAGVGSRSVCFSGKAGNQHRTFKSCVPCSADLVISRRLLKLEKTGQ